MPDTDESYKISTSLHLPHSQLRKDYIVTEAGFANMSPRHVDVTSINHFFTIMAAILFVFTIFVAVICWKHERHNDATEYQSGTDETSERQNRGYLWSEGYGTFMYDGNQIQRLVSTQNKTFKNLIMSIPA
jgi:fucose permease